MAKLLPDLSSWPARKNCIAKYANADLQRELNQAEHSRKIDPAELLLGQTEVSSESSYCYSCKRWILWPVESIERTSKLGSNNSRHKQLIKELITFRQYYHFWIFFFCARVSFLDHVLSYDLKSTEASNSSCAPSMGNFVRCLSI